MYKTTSKALMASAVALLLIMSTGLMPVKSFASGGHDDDREGKIKAIFDLDKKGSSQKSDQDNFAYRSDDPEQANEGQQLLGKDNEATGFNEQSSNFPALTPQNGNGPGTGNGAGNGTGGGTGSGGNGINNGGGNVTRSPCENCFINNLSTENYNKLVTALTTTGITLDNVTYHSIAELCLALENGSLNIREFFLLVLGVLGDDQTTIEQIRGAFNCVSDLLE